MLQVYAKTSISATATNSHVLVVPANTTTAVNHSVTVIAGAATPVESVQSSTHTCVLANRSQDEAGRHLLTFMCAVEPSPTPTSITFTATTGGEIAAQLGARECLCSARSVCCGLHCGGDCQFVTDLPTIQNCQPLPNIHAPPILLTDCSDSAAFEVVRVGSYSPAISSTPETAEGFACGNDVSGHAIVTVNVWDEASANEVDVEVWRPGGWLSSYSGCTRDPSAVPADAKTVTFNCSGFHDTQLFAVFKIPANGWLIRGLRLAGSRAGALQLARHS